MKYLKTLNAVHARLDRLGDLPVFSATVNRIQQISSSKESDAMALALAVMKDANLSARLLRLANSSYCNRGQGRINVISRAVVLIGFDQIKSLSVTLKLIESFSKANPEVDISGLLVRSFITAVIAREIGSKAGIDDIEETYTCGLLHGLGETIIAYTLPEIYNQMLALRAEGKSDWKRLQLETLGGQFSDIGQDMAESWGFPPAVVQSMDAMTAENLRGDARLNYQLALLADQMLQQVYGDAPHGGESFSELLTRLQNSVKLDAKTVSNCFNSGFKMVCALAKEYGLPHKRLIPRVRDSGDEALDEFTRKVAYLIHTQDSDAEEPAAPAPPAQAAPAAAEPLAQRQLDYLQQIGDMVSAHSPMQQVLSKVVEAIEDSTHCSRAGFCLLSRDRKSLSLKIARGACVNDLLGFFQLERGLEVDEFFFRLLSKGQPLLVTDTQESNWRERLPQEFLNDVNPRGFILAPLGVGQKMLGFLYADKLADEGPIGPEDFRGFNQFFMQTKMALAYNDQQARTARRGPRG